MKSKSNESLLFDYLNDVKLQDLPIFNLEELATAHYKKNEQLRRAYCGGCKNCRYMSPIAARFWPAVIHKIYCGVFRDRRYR